MSPLSPGSLQLPIGEDWLTLSPESGQSCATRLTMTNFIIRSITFLLALSLPIVAFVWFQTPGMYPFLLHLTAHVLPLRFTLNSRWVGKDGSKQDGFSFNPGNGTTPSLNWQYFNFHPFLMILGFGFFGTSGTSNFAPF